ncbi:hypothetical protein CR513_57262, partial [Mucuna pruriens]
MTLKEMRCKYSLYLSSGKSNVRSSLYSPQYCFCGGSFWKDVKIANAPHLDTSTYWLDELSLGSLLRVVDGIERLLKIYCDNNLAVLYSNNNRSSTKSKFIDIKFLVVKERIQNKQISTEHIETNFMLADPLTKRLIPKVFHEHTAHMEIKLMILLLVMCNPKPSSPSQFLTSTKTHPKVVYFKFK